MRIPLQMLVVCSIFLVSACQTIGIMSEKPVCETPHEEFVADVLRKIEGVQVVKMTDEQRDRFIEKFNSRSGHPPISPVEVYFFVSRIFPQVIIEGVDENGCMDGYIFVPARALGEILTSYLLEDSI